MNEPLSNLLSDLLSDLLSNLLCDLSRAFSDRQKGGVTQEGGVPAQVSRLANAVMAYAKNIENVPAILPTVISISHKHVCRAVQPVQYDAVGECLLAAMKQVLGDAASPTFMAAWTQAVTYLAHIFIQTETDLRASLEGAAGFAGLTEVNVVQSTKEGDEVVLDLAPLATSVPPYAPGQFVGLKVQLANGEHTMTTMKLVQGDGSAVRVAIPDIKEKASLWLRACSAGDKMRMSVPCGVVKKLHPKSKIF